jgi:hypothetical protein
LIQDYTTDGNGQTVVAEIEWDNYRILMPESPAYDVSGTNPLHPIIVQPASEIDATIALTSHTDNSLLLTLTDNADTPIASASANLKDSGTFDETKFTGNEADPDYGQVFFSNLSPLDYFLHATASGYLDFDSVISVNGTTNEKAILVNE